MNDDTAVLTPVQGRTIRAPRGQKLSCKGWLQEAALRMLMNNLDPDVAEKPEELIVYGGTGKAARDLGRYGAIFRRPPNNETGQTPRLQSRRDRRNFTAVP